MRVLWRPLSDRPCLAWAFGFRQTNRPRRMAPGAVENKTPVRRLRPLQAVDRLRGELALRVGDGRGARDIAGHVQAGAAHVQDDVDPGDEAHAFNWQTHALEHHGQHDQAGARDPRRADGCQGGQQDDHEVLGETERHVVDGGDEQGGDPLVDGGPVHVPRGSQRQREADEVSRQTQLLLGDPHRHGQGGVAAPRDEGHHHDLEGPLKNLNGLTLAKNLTMDV